jgi:hypothetical protein
VNPPKSAKNPPKSAKWAKTKAQVRAKAAEECLVYAPLASFGSRATRTTFPSAGV